MKVPLMLIVILKFFFLFCINTFTTIGYITFEECGDMINPTLGLELGTTYIFDQSDISNFSHPLGFSYFPDGGHVGKPNLDRETNHPESLQ